jgi:hypothetical protein
MWQIYGRKECTLTRGDLTDMEEMNFSTWSKKVCREKSAEVVVPGARQERTES